MKKKNRCQFLIIWKKEEVNEIEKVMDEIINKFGRDSIKFASKTTKKIKISGFTLVFEKFSKINFLRKNCLFL